MQKSFLILLSFIFVLGMSKAKTNPETKPSSKPNIVLFFVDDLGWTDLGFRNKMFETPNIDKLATDGINFEQCYVASPTCSPSRSTLLTGKHPVRLQMVRHIPGGPKHPDFDKYSRTKVEFNYWEGDPAHFPCRNWLPLEHTSYAQALKQQGYYNLFVGKWHLGQEEYHPIHHGFDKQIGTTNAGHPASYYPPYFHNSDVFADEKERYLSDKLTDETVDFIESYSKTQPFMISLWHYGVHRPLVGRKDLFIRYKKKGYSDDDAHYAAMIGAVDESLGRIRDALQKKGIADHTIILFTSDQGSWFENPPYRGCKTKETLYEGGARVPFFVYWPGVTKAGSVNKSVVQTTDIFPTLVEISGGKTSDFKDLDGVSLLSIIEKNNKLKRGEPIYGYRAYQDLYGSVREGAWKLLVYRSGDMYLYNVEKDRYEAHDLKAKKPKKVNELVEKLKAWEKEMNVEQYSGVQ